MNKSAYIVLSLFLTAIFIHSCNNAVSNDIWKDEIMAIKKLLFIYDSEIIDYDSKERADTLFRKTGLFPPDSARHLVYVSTGDCSSCIGDLMNFLFILEQDTTLPAPTILVKGDNDELLKYYLGETNKKYLSFKRHVISQDAYSPDGIYIVVRGRIIDYSPWNKLLN